MKEFAVVYEQAGDNFSAYVPDLPGCIAAGDTLEETKELMRKAIVLHIAGMHQDGERVPEPTTFVENLAIAA